MQVSVRSIKTYLSKTPLELRILGVMMVALLWVYWATCAEMARRWGSQSLYTHGFLVPIFSLYLLWSRRAMLPTANLRPSWWGVPFLMAGLGLRLVGVYVYFDWLEAASLLPCVAAACLFAGGWQTLRWAWPGIAFLVFMIPLPFTVEVALSQPLQRLGTEISTFTLQTLGLAAYAEGNVIVMGLGADGNDVRIGVVEACSGLAMLMTFFALSSAVTLLIRRSPLERTVIFLSAVPIALAANIIRIIVTAFLHKTVGREWAERVFHDLAGYLMPILALGMLWGLLRLLSWVLVPRAAPQLTKPAFRWSNPSGGRGGTLPVPKPKLAGAMGARKKEAVKEGAPPGSKSALAGGAGTALDQAIKEGAPPSPKPAPTPDAGTAPDEAVKEGAPPSPKSPLTGGSNP